MRAFRTAVEAGDMDAGTALLADDVTFRSPAVFTPYQGREAVSHILRTVFEVFEDFRYTDEATSSPTPTVRSRRSSSRHASATRRCRAST